MPSILVVDDDVPTRQLLRLWLEAWKFDVREAVAAETAIEAMSEAPPDVLLADIYLPGADGLSLIREVRERWPETIIIMVSAIKDLHIIKESQAAGAVGFVAKPMGREALYQALTRATNRFIERRSRQERFSGGDRRKKA